MSYEMENYPGDYDPDNVVSVYGTDWKPREQVADPSGTFETLMEISAKAKEAVDATDDPSELFKTLVSIGRTTVENDHLPVEVREELKSISIRAMKDLRVVAENREVDSGDPEAVAHTVQRDVKHLGHVPLRE